MQEQQTAQRVRLDGYQVFWQTLAAILVAGLIYVAVVLLLAFASISTDTPSDEGPFSDFDPPRPPGQTFCEANPESLACQPGGVFYEP